MQRARYISASNGISLLKTHWHQLFNLSQRYNKIQPNVRSTSNSTKQNFCTTKTRKFKNYTQQVQVQINDRQVYRTHCNSRRDQNRLRKLQLNSQ